MEPLRYTLVCDGPTDANLIPLINWTLQQSDPTVRCEGATAKYWQAPKKPKNLVDKIKWALDFYPCKVLFVHRDAEKIAAPHRLEEIGQAVATVARDGKPIPAVAVVPVRMLEAWLLFDERAIRWAAGNPNGRQSLNLPPLRQVENIPDPKTVLKEVLRRASERQGRRLKSFDTQHAFWRITDYLEDYSPLRGLPAYQRLETAIHYLFSSHCLPELYGANIGQRS